MAVHAKQASFIGYGSLIHAWRNEVKFTLDMVSQDTNISKGRLSDLERGYEKPTWDELEKLAKEFFVGVRDLLPFEDDRSQGVVILRDSEARKFDQTRSEALQYTYISKAMTSALPNFKPIELLLHLTDKNKVVNNRGHFFHQFTQVLHGGPVGFVWEWEGEKIYEEFDEGDSWIITGFVPHGFWSPNPDNLGRILAITFGQQLASTDVRQELNLIGSQNVHRIINDPDEYFLP
jgi:transcriptional regulator with XRE-family HTH domain